VAALTPLGFAGVTGIAGIAGFAVGAGFIPALTPQV